MAHEEIILNLMQSLVIADKHIIGDLMSHKGLWTTGTSSVNNSYKALCNLVEEGKLIKSDGFFKLPTCKSLYKEHAQLLTKALAEVLKLNLDCKILREPMLDEIGLRPDAIVFLIKNEMANCFILEVCNNETQEYLTNKVNAWKVWSNSHRALEILLGFKVPRFDIVVSGQSQKGTFDFIHYIKEVSK